MKAQARRTTHDDSRMRILYVLREQDTRCTLCGVAVPHDLRYWVLILDGEDVATCCDDCADVYIPIDGWVAS